MTETVDTADAVVDIANKPISELLADAVDDGAKPQSIFDIYDTDINEEEEGRWFPLAPNVEFKIRRFTAKAVNNERNKLNLAFRKHARRDGTYPDPIAERIVLEQMGTLIVDWRGSALVRRDGSPLEYSPDAAKELMKQLPNLRAQVLMISMDMAAFRTADRKEIEGN